MRTTAGRMLRHEKIKLVRRKGRKGCEDRNEEYCPPENLYRILHRTKGGIPAFPRTFARGCHLVAAQPVFGIRHCTANVQVGRGNDTQNLREDVSIEESSEHHSLCALQQFQHK
eukprot:1503151-Rhodomonas_salina.1